MTFTYNYSLSSDFGGNINIGDLKNEIEAEGGITPVLSGITRNDDDIDIIFESALSGGEQTTLNGLVSTHGGNSGMWQTLEKITITSAQSPYQAFRKSLKCNTTNGSITVNLPMALFSYNTVIGIKKTKAVNTVIIDPFLSELIDGQSTKTLTSNGETVIVKSNGTSWDLVVTEDVVTAVDNYINNPITTNKGSMIVDDGNEQKELIVGTDGHVIIADSTEELGVKWATVGDVTGVRHYGASATDPVSPSPQAGDKYYNTAINHEMCYDGSRSKWLSVATLIDGGGRNGTTAAGVYYKRWNGMAMAATVGPHVAKGTIVRIGYGTSVAVTHTYEVLLNGSVIASLASGGAASAYDDTVNADFDAGIMSSRSASGSATTTNLQSTIYYKLRV